MLYTSEVLALATGLAACPFDPAAPAIGEARSQTCGSTIRMSLVTDSEGRIAKVGLAAQACAIGQASAMLFAENAIKRSSAELATADTEIAEWLAGGPLPSWPGFAAIAAARDYPARHGAIRLPWKAALAALAALASGGAGG